MEPFSASTIVIVAIGVLSVVAFAMGLLAILEAKALSRPRRRRTT